MRGSGVRRSLRPLVPERLRGVVGRSAPAPDPGQDDGPGGRLPGKPAGGGTDPRFERAYVRLIRAALGPESISLDDAADVTYDGALVREGAQTARRHRAMATLAERLSTGAVFEDAVVDTVRAMADAGSWHTARALAWAVRSMPGGETASTLGLAYAAYARGHHATAWDSLTALEPEVLARHLAVPAVDCALRLDTPESRRLLDAVVADERVLSPEDRVDLAGRFVVTGDLETARRLADAARDEESSLDEGRREALHLLDRWLSPPPAPVVPEGAVPFAVIDYHQPDYVNTSQNVGDYVQTLAMLGNLARFRGVDVTGEESLGELVTELQGRVRPDLELTGAEGARLHLLPVSRDFSEGDPIPENTWMVAFGWHMHPLFELRYGLPYHENLNPVFVSFHVNEVDCLTPEALDYLRAHGPIGCRDWTTVDLLLSAGVDAFFTGCLTTTVSAVFPEREAVAPEGRAPAAVIDVPAAMAKRTRPPYEVLTHSAGEYRTAGLVEGTRAAIELLERYQRTYRRINTSRLHSYLPATSLGLPVRFTPRIPGDVRFDGLYGMKPESPEFTAIRDGIRSLLAEVFAKVLSGADPESVYALWRELTAERVAEARRRWDEPHQPSGPLDVAATARRIAADARRYGPDVADGAAFTDVALSSDENFAEHLLVTAESLVANATGPLRLWITSRGIDRAYEERFARLFPDVSVVFLPFDGVEYGEIGRMIPHITVATMDRLLLAEVLPDVERITYVDIDTVTLGDVCELAATDLGGTPFAARTSVWSAATSWRDVGNTLPPELSYELQRVIRSRQPFDFTTFNAGVLVLDLVRLRADRFAEEFLPWAARYGLHDQDLLLAYAGPDRASLDPRWNALPVLENIADPGIVHFAGAAKPWTDELTPYRDLWQDYARQVREREASLDG